VLRPGDEVLIVGYARREKRGSAVAPLPQLVFEAGRGGRPVLIAVPLYDAGTIQIDAFNAIAGALMLIAGLLFVLKAL
jgi:hypothetical protein